MRLLRAIHRLFRPNCNCNVCGEPKCESCERLDNMLGLERKDKDMLLNIIYNFSQEQNVLPVEEKEIEPIGPRIVPWEKKRAELERSDRIKNETQKNEDDATMRRINELEKELGITGNESD